MGVGFMFAILPYVYAQESIPPPLKQLNSGVSIPNIKCKESFVLIIQKNGDPTCVKPTSVSRLLSHGWITLENFEANHPVLQQNKPNIVFNQTSYNNITLITNNVSENKISINKIQSDCSKGLKAYPDGYGLSELMISPKTSSLSGNLQILCILMSPSNPKVGDTVTVGLLITNISDRLLWFMGGFCLSPLHYEISPENNVQEIPCPGEMSKMGVWNGPLAPNEFGVVVSTSNYKIIKPGTLALNLDLHYAVAKKMWSNLHNATVSDYLEKAHANLYAEGASKALDTIQFDINAT